MLTRRTALTLLATSALAGAGMLAFGRGDGTAPFDISARAQGSVPIPDITLGDPAAPVKVVEYASYTCPHCADFHNDTFKDFKRDYIDTGKVHFTYREVFFDRYGLWAAMVARCAGPERYFGVAELLYSTQSDWARAGEPADVAAALKRVGAQAGMDQETLDACMQDAAKAESLVAWYQANAERDGVRSTPSFLINGDMHTGNMSLGQIGQLVDEAA
ncbi:DsbA family protein [Jannaschia ovalis]|uniref:DsbA family protein n=1 Tax=Jannaschia ovalis TaxID=3038773 RepID=A0ABY8L9Q6_9RHOB|nr:DsbA family protein [Jannaschia sp. GRR-S6-38]WGH77342.1 DsbA family protein [Jannaschia sp. GRR-S6-38]